jgi:hypothetical protein
VRGAVTMVCAQSGRIVHECPVAMRMQTKLLPLIDGMEWLLWPPGNGFSRWCG